MKTIKYVLAIVIGVSGFGIISKGSMLGGICLVLLGIILTPPLSEKIKDVLKIWKNKGVRYTSYIAFFLASAGIISKSGISNHSTQENLNNEAEIAYKEYLDKTSLDITNLSDERTKQRNKWLNELEKNSVYIELVKNKTIKTEYLPTLTAISAAIQNACKIDGKSQFRISDEIAKKIEQSNNGESKMQFIVNVSSLSLKMNGGLTKEIIEMLDRYKTKYGLYNDGQKIFFDNSGKSEKLNDGFNITAAIVLFSPNDKKALNALYESNFSTLGNWSDEEIEFENDFMIQKTAYIRHLKLNYPESKYLPKMEKCKVWNKYDPIVKDRIELMIFNKDCGALQEEFDATAENSERIHASGRTANRNLDLMDFLDEQMKELDCYK